MKFKRPTRDQEQSAFSAYQSTQPGQRTGAFRRAYLKLAYREQASEQVAVQAPRHDISTSDTMIMPSMERPIERRQNEGQQVVHITSSFDIRAIGLPDIIDRQIKRHLEQFGTYPDAILLNAESIGFLRERGLTRGDGAKEEIIYKGRFKLRIDQTLSGVKVALRRSELAS